MLKTFPKKSTKISMSVFPRFFKSRFRVFLSDGFKNTTKSGLKTTASKVFLQKIHKNPKPIFFSILFYILSRIWALSGEGSKKTPRKSNSEGRRLVESRGLACYRCSTPWPTPIHRVYS
jgi:hypothetical protein